MSQVTAGGEFTSAWVMPCISSFSALDDIYMRLWSGSFWIVATMSWIKTLGAVKDGMNVFYMGDINLGEHEWNSKV